MSALDSIPRLIAPRLEQLLARRPCVVLTGCRQTGKTHLARQLVDARGDFVSLDLPHVAEEAERSGGAFLARHGRPLCIDEVQYAPTLFRALKHDIDSHRKSPGRFVLTGSSPFPLMARVSESLAGRAAIVHLLPLCLDEIATAHDGLPPFDEVIVTGAFPELHARGLDHREFFASLIVTYLERDLRSQLAVRNLRDFDRFSRLLALRVANLIDIGALAQDVGVAVNTVKAWLSVLEASGLVTLVAPWHGNIGKRLVKTPKVFFVDTGLACALLGLDSVAALARSQLAGALFENLVWLEIQKSLTNAGLRRDVHFYRDHAGLECDFVVSEGERLHLVEAKRAEDARTPAAFDKLRALLGSDKIASATLVTPITGRFERGEVVVRGPAGGAWPWDARAEE